MSPRSPALALLLTVSACSPADDPADDPPSAPAPAELGDACAASGYAPAPPDAPACGDEMACDTDEACSKYSGNYCRAAACETEGCLRGRCTPKRVQGEACSRGAECLSEECACPDGGGGGGAGDGGSCACTAPDGGTFHF